MARNKQQSKTTFEPFVEVVDIPSLSSFSDIEIQSAWYNGYEYSMMQDNSREELALLARGIEIPLDDDNLCREGVETPEDEYHRQNITREALNAVFTEQAYHWNAENITEDIAYVYAKCTNKAKKEAHDRALRISNELRYYYNNNNDSKEEKTDTACCELHNKTTITTTPTNNNITFPPPETCFRISMTRHFQPPTNAHYLLSNPQSKRVKGASRFLIDQAVSVILEL